MSAGTGRRVPSLPLVLALCGALSTACAERAGGRATEGMLEAFRAPPPEGGSRPAERLGREATEGALAQLSSPAGLTSVAAVVDAAVTRSLEAALRAPPPGVQGRHVAGAGRSLVERMSQESAAAIGAGLSAELLGALGPDGRGPLATSISAAVAEASRSAVRGARGELGDLFAGCEGRDRDACVDAKVRSLGRAAAAGFVEGVMGSVAWVIVALAFLVGVAASLVAQATLRGLQRGRPRPRPREAHP